MDEEPKQSVPVKKKKSSLGLKVAVTVIILALLGLSGFLYAQLKDAQNNPEKVSQQQVTLLVEKVSKLIALPTDEQPTVATVQDKEKLAEQPFFSGAENGDKLLIYTKAQKAIIYRESSNSLINVGPVTLDTTTSTSDTPTENSN